MASPDKSTGRSEGEPKPAAPAISLPKGGGAIRGIGEKFAANPVTGTGSMSVPFAVSPGRSGFGPQLSLSYDSGSGNGPFGFGWSLGLPAITRKTDKGLPQYLDGEEPDVFILSGAEDLVPVYKVDPDGNVREGPDGKPLFEEREEAGFRVRRYRPRIEGLFARIERWTDMDSGDVHWRSISRDNVLTLYGKDASSRIFDPEDDRRIFSWLICETRDDKGNAVLYDYKAEDGTGVDRSQAHQRNRGDLDDVRRTANRYLKHIRYGNRVPQLDAAGKRPRFLTADQITKAGWMFEVVFDYGEHDAVAPKPGDDGPWTYRNDPFSSYRSGFEVRICRLCQRVLMFHHFADEAGIGNDCLVRSTDLTYSYEEDPASARNPIYSFLRAVTQSGYRRQGDGYLARSLPPVEFECTQPSVQATVEDVDAATLENLPMGVDGSSYQWTDLHGEGIPGILTEQANAWFYKRNVSPISERPVEFAPLELVATKPNLALAGGQAQFMDLAGDGQPDLVVLDGPMPGLYEHDGEEGWQPFRPFTSRLSRDTHDPNLKLVDLDGDGHADVLISENDAFVWHPSLAEKGFGPARRVQQALDEEKGPRLVFADGEQSIHLADLSGDGLTDLVRIRNGEICYWPNLGYGRFGAKITMDGAPHFDNPDQFDPKRLRLADIDGSGTTDIIYLHRGGVRLYFNQSGNSWSPAKILAVFPPIDSLASIVATDLLGNGTACLVWSSPLPGDARRPMRYVDLMGGKKPHLLVRTINNLGAETRVEYASSTRFYLQDKRDGKPWITKLPFPVHVVERVENYDWIGRCRYVTRYAYHHGYFDGDEREFRGFGRVDQWDTEEQRGDTDFPTAVNWDEASWTPPMRTCTWFHTGAFLEAGAVSRQYAREYWTEPALRGEDRAADREAMLLPDTVLPSDLAPDEIREAYRTLKGRPLRTESYAEDGSPRAGTPYSVTEQNFAIRRLQPQGGNQAAVFFAHPREKVSFHYEREPKDPRVTHEITLEADRYGNVLRSVAVGYPRRPGHPDPEPDLSAAFRGMLAYDQARLHIAAIQNLFTEDTLTDAAVLPDVHRTPLPAETITAELTGITPAANRPGITNLFRFDELEGHWGTVWNEAHDVPYEEVPAADVDGTGPLPAGLARRIVEHTRTVYRRDDLTALLPPGQLQSLAFPGESYRLALTPGLIDRIFGDRVADATLIEGGYVQLPAGTGWWMPSGRVFYSPGDADAPAAELAEALDHFFQPRRLVDPLGGITRVAYDGYDLLATSTVDPVGNTTAAANDYRVLQPFEITDPNGNRAQAAYDALGLVAGTAVMGKTTEDLGDSLDGFDPDPGEPTVLAHLADPLVDPGAILGDASSRLLYDVFAYHRTRDAAQPSPVVVYTLTRETHVSALGPGETTRFQHAFSYSDGFGRGIQRKVQAEGGRWVGSGWTLFNNKGNAVRKYEPFFSATHRFEFARETGVSSVFFYDPAGRIVATLHPNDTWEKVVFENWRRETWDVNDTVRIDDPREDGDVGGYFQRFLGASPDAFTSWHERRIGGAWGGSPERRAGEQDAARKAEAHRETPSVIHFDALGRPCLTVADNGAAGRFGSRTAYDAEGKPLAVFDALGRRVFEYCRRDPREGGGFRYISGYDLAGTAIYRNGMDGGERRSLANVAGRPLRAWDALERTFRFRHDPLQRTTHVYTIVGGGETLLERSIYGEGMADRNLCGRLFRRYDDAGAATDERYDFKGNLLESARQFAREYRQSVDWSALADLTAEADLDTAAAPLLSDGERYLAATRYDALNRPIQTVTPHRGDMRPSVLQPSYNEANLLEKIDVWIQRAIVPGGLLDPHTADLHAVTTIDYNARGQRLSLALGNGTVTTYEHDPQTFRLTRLTTARPDSFAANERIVQDLTYLYDPAGNVTRIRDNADLHNVVFFRNQRVEPSSDYTYDAVYRLISATGREHLGQTGGVLNPPRQVDHDDSLRSRLDHPGDGNAMGTYTETFIYDPAGNLLALLHQVGSGAWTRRFRYAEPSRIDAAEVCNRLSATSLPGDPEEGPYTDVYEHDAHGDMIRMPHLRTLTWDERDRLRSTVRQVVNGGTPEVTRYVYDAGGERLRKTTDRQSGARRTERLYFGGFELYREFAADGETLTLERETLHVRIGDDRLALIETPVAGTGPVTSRIRFQYANHLGSAALELDRDAEVLTYEEYFPYGATAYQAVRGQVEKRYRYTGKERDEENGLYDHGARYYAPWLARWTSPDPAGLIDGPNLYAYVRGRPSTLRDPDGLRPQEVPEQPRPRVPGSTPAPVQPTGSTGSGSRGQPQTPAQAPPRVRYATRENIEELARIVMSETSSRVDREAELVAHAVLNRMLREHTTQVGGVQHPVQHGSRTVTRFARDQAPSAAARDVARDVLTRLDRAWAERTQIQSTLQQTHGIRATATDERGFETQIYRARIFGLRDSTGRILDPSGGATHFLSPATQTRQGRSRPNWADPRNRAAFPRAQLRSPFDTVPPQRFEFYRAPGVGPTR